MNRQGKNCLSNVSFTRTLMVFDDEIDSLVQTRKNSGLVDSYEKKLNEFLFYAYQ